MLWGLGICQAMIVTALSIKISTLGDYFKPGIQASVIRDNIKRADTCAKWFYVAATASYCTVSTLMVILSFPIMNIIDQTGYNIAYLVQIGIMVIYLSIVLGILNYYITKLSSLSECSFVEESQKM